MKVIKEGEYTMPCAEEALARVDRSDLVGVKQAAIESAMKLAEEWQRRGEWENFNTALEWLKRMEGIR